MHIVHLKLLNFRNYDHLNLEFSSHTNIIYGNNGTGKTNLVEAIYVLSLTKSFRGTMDRILIQDTKNLTRIDGEIGEKIFHNYQLMITPEGKSAKIDGTKYPKLSDYISKIQVVLFQPDDLRMVKDSPSVRRSHLNIDISTMHNTYLKLLNQYTKVLKQRNAYLKTMYLNGNASRDYLQVLTDKLIDLGMELYSYRKDFFIQIEPLISSYYEKITGISSMKVSYESVFEGKSKEEIQKIYQQNLEKDMLFGKTTFGVHHDDFTFTLEGKPIKDYASEGQLKNAVIAYKLALIQFYKKELHTLPILILDDLFSELDQEKVEHILDLIDEDIQTFITTTSIEFMSDSILNKSKVFICSDTGIREES